MDVATLHFVQERYQDSRAARPDWVAQRDAPADAEQ